MRSRMIRSLVVASTLFLAATAVPARAAERGLLWRVVQTCLIDHALTGGSFPCLRVDTADGLERGFAVLRAPFERLHVIVTPTVRTIGIEDARLMAPDAPNYFADAWTARRFVADDLVQKPGRSDLALAINSKPGRSQDQLHIHVACVRPEVKRSLTSLAATLQPGRFASVRVLPKAPRYMAMPLTGADLAAQNPFTLVADGLKPTDMADVTIVLVGTGGDDRPGFVLLARSRLHNVWDDAHGEALLDGSCRAFR